MVELIAYFKRRPGMSVAAFSEHWRTRHAELVAKLPGLRRYVQCHTLPSVYATREPVYDAVARVCFDGDDPLPALSQRPEYAAVRADEASFIDPASLGSILVEARVIVDAPPPADGVVNVAFLTRLASVSVEDFQAHWHDRHGPIAGSIPGIRRYVQCHARGSIDGVNAPAWDGIALAWFDGTQAMRGTAGSDAYKRTRADEANFLASGPPFVIAREHVIV
jgi:uncharacterized protein (TIGR02118 family)